MPQIKVQNLYETTLTEAGGIAASGDASFSVANPPTYTNGWIVVDSDNLAKRELMYYHNVVGSTVSVRSENRTSPKAHSSGATIKMLDVAEIFNYFSDMVSQAFYTEKTGGLTVKVWGGYATYNGATVTIADTNLTMTDNATNYIKYDYPTNTISADTVNAGNIKVVVTTLSGVITSITYRNPKESFIDFTVSLTGALPNQSGQAGKVLTTDGTNVSWQDGVVNASSTVAGKLEVATSTEILQGTATGGTGAPLAITPDQLATVYYFGDGSDGDVTISANTTLTRDMYYNNLTVNTTFTLDPAGYAIHVRGTLTLSGTAKIARNGNNATNASGITPGTGGAALATGTCGPCLGGQTGGAGIVANPANGNPGGNGIAVAVSYATTGSSVAGGNGGNRTPALVVGAGGTSATHTRGTLYNTLFNFGKILSILSTPSRVINTTPYGGLASSGAGGGGAGDSVINSGAGGGSGGNGGIILLYANILAGTGTIEAKGGNGGNGSAASGANAGGGGGGSGGCGGVVFLVYKTGTPYTITLTGGTGGTAGAGGGTGTAGVAGSTGTTGTSITIQV